MFNNQFQFVFSPLPGVEGTSSLFFGGGGLEHDEEVDPIRSKILEN